jgi:hypothetical protein
MYKHSRRTQERFQRYLQERLGRGEEYDAAFEGTLKDAGLTNPEDLLSGDDDKDAESFAAEFDWSEDDDDEFEPDEEDDEFGMEDESDNAEDEQHAESEGKGGSSAESESSTSDDADSDLPDRRRHPLLERASQFWMRLHDLFHETPAADESAPKKPHVSEATLRTLFDGAGDLCGGLAQAFTHPEDHPSHGLCIVQLKRALRGLAFARGGLCNVSVSGAVPKEVVKSMHATLDELETEVFQELARVRESARPQ